jgi:hypothetical protein
MNIKFISKSEAMERVLSHAEYGGRVLEVVTESEKPKTLWAGLGNRAGLHSYADVIMQEKWEKSGERFKRKIDKNMHEGTVLQLQTFQNTTRDRGRWVTIETLGVQ